jgi:glycosyltransferase involved in cell wall biosynthesis
VPFGAEKGFIMRIVLVSSWPTDVIGGSGTAVYFNALHDGLRDRGYEVEAITPNFDITDYVEVTLKRFLFNTELRTDPRVLSADLVFGFDYDGYGLDNANRPPMITTAHAVYGDVIRWESEPARTMVEAQAFFDRVAMQKADRITIGSQYAKERLVTLYGLEADKIEVIPHGMLQPGWLRLLRSEPRVENDHPVILSVGKMYPRKRTNILLEALALLRNKYPTLELRIVGDGLEWDRLHAVADQLKVQDRVTWLGHIADDRAFAREWRQADILCHPSCQETFGYVYLEAMTAGLPIVAARAGAAPEVLGDAALLAEPENPQSLAEALDRFLQDEVLRQRYARRAEARAGQFSHARMIDQYVRLIEEVIANADSRRREGASLSPTGWPKAESPLHFSFSAMRRMRGRG